MTQMHTAASSDITSAIDLYDSDIKKITEGPVAWANTRVGSARNVDDFHKGLTEQFHKIGFLVDVQVWTMGECRCSPRCRDAEACRRLISIPGAYTFKCEIQGRMQRESGFDYDRMQHEIQNNLLNIKGEGGKIKFDEKEFLRQHGGGKKHGHH